MQNFRYIDFESACWLKLTKRDVAVHETVQNFTKINFDFFVSVKQDEKKRGIMMASSRWPPFAKFCKNEFRLFCKRQAERKKVPPNYGELAMATIREILQKLISIFF